MLRVYTFVTLLILLTGFASPQSNADPATVTFTIDFPGSLPSHYSIQVQRNGASRYESSGRSSSESQRDDEFSYNFTTSEATRQRIFELAAKAEYFQKDLDAHRKNMAFTGKKTLAYKDSTRTGESTYNYSQNLPAQELTDLFQAISATLEFGHRLADDRRYQKLALAEELKRMEDSARTSPPVEIQAIAPILQQIVNDPGVINVTRARAQRLLESGAKPGQ